MDVSPASSVARCFGGSRSDKAGRPRATTAPLVDKKLVNPPRFRSKAVDDKPGPGTHDPTLSFTRTNFGLAMRWGKEDRNKYLGNPENPAKLIKWRSRLANGMEEDSDDSGAEDTTPGPGQYDRRDKHFSAQTLTNEFCYGKTCKGGLFPGIARDVRSVASAGGGRRGPRKKLADPGRPLGVGLGSTPPQASTSPRERPQARRFDDDGAREQVSTAVLPSYTDEDADGGGLRKAGRETTTTTIDIVEDTYGLTGNIPKVKSEVITPEPNSPTFGYTKEKSGEIKVGSWFRRLAGGGVVDVHTIRVARLSALDRRLPGGSRWTCLPEREWGVAVYSAGGCPTISSRTSD